MSTRSSPSGAHPLDIIPVFRRWPASPSRNLVYTFLWSSLIGLLLAVATCAFMGTVRPFPRIVVLMTATSNIIGFLIHGALAALRLGESLNGRVALGLGVAFAGAVLVTFGSGHGMRFEPHALLVLVAVLASSVYFVWQKPLLARTTPLGFTTASIFAGTLGLLPFGLHLPQKLALAPTPQIASAIYLGVMPTVLGYVLWNWALSRASASTVSSFLYAQPLLASLIAWFWLGQTLGALVIAGGVLAIGGVVLTIRGAQPCAARPLAAATRIACTAVVRN